MTVVVALSCDEGIVLASDSQETAGMNRRSVRKLWDVNGRLAWGAAGDTALTERLVVHGQQLAAHLDLDYLLLADQILAVTTPLQRFGLDGHVALANTEAPTLGALFCWCAPDGTPRIFQVEPTGAHSCFRWGVAAIGSGGPFAQVALSSVAHLGTNQLDLERLKMVAYKAVNDVIATSSWGVGWPIQMYTITPGAGAEFVGFELNAIRDSVTAWMDEERRVLGELGRAPDLAGGAEQAMDVGADPGIEPEGEERVVGA